MPAVFGMFSFQEFPCGLSGVVPSQPSKSLLLQHVAGNFLGLSLSHAFCSTKFPFFSFSFVHVDFLLRPAVGEPCPALVLPKNLCRRPFLYTSGQMNLIPDSFKRSHNHVICLARATLGKH